VTSQQTAAERAVDLLSQEPQVPASSEPTAQEAYQEIGALFPEARKAVESRRRSATQDYAGQAVDLIERTRPLDMRDKWNEILEQPGSLVGFWSAGLEANKLAKLTSYSRAMEAGSATPEQEKFVLDELAHGLREKTFGYDVLDLAAQSVPFAQEFALGMGVGGAATGAARAGAKAGAKKLVGAFAREAAEEASKRGAMVGLRRGVGKAAEFAARTGIMVGFNEAASTGLAAAMDLDQPGGRVTADAYQRMLSGAGIQVSKDEAGELAVAFEATMPSFMEVLPAAITSQLIEGVSEQAGGALMKPVAEGLKRIPMPAKVAAIQADVFRWWKAKNPDKPVTEFTKTILERGGWHGAWGEMSEERLGSALRAAAPWMEESWGEVWPGWRQMGVELAAFSLPSAAQAGAATVDMALQSDPATLTAGLDAQEAQPEGTLTAGLDGPDAPTEGVQGVEQGVEQGQPEIDPAAIPEAADQPPINSDQTDSSDQAGAEVPADAAPALEANEATEAPATPQEAQEPPKAIRIPSEQQGQLPASMRVSRPQDPLLPDESGEAEVPIGDELRGRLEDPPEPLPGQPVNKPQIVSAMAKAVEAVGGTTPFKSGKVKGKQALGFYRPSTDVIRIKTANDLTTAAHEMGHALDRHLFGKVGAVSEQVGPAEHRELHKIGKGLYGDRRPAAGYRSEGFAEWMNWWATDPARAKKEAPKFTAWFEGTFLPANEAVAGELAKVRDYTTRWRQQGAAERVRQSIIDPASPGARVKRATSGAATGLVRNMIEEGLPLRSLSREARKSAGGELAAGKDPYKVFSALRMTHAAVVNQMVNQGMRDFAGNQVGPSLAEIRPLIKGRYADFRDYLIARRARALLTDPQGPRNPGITEQDADAVVEKYDSPEFQSAASKLYEWNEGVLSYAAQSSPSFAKVVEAIRERDPGDYVPLYREIDDAARQFLGSGRKGGTPAKRLRGSGRRIKDPIQGVLASADAWVKAAHKRVVLDAILDVSKLPGMGHIIEKVPKDQVPVATRSLEDMIEQVKAEAAKAGGKVEVTTENVDLASEMLTLFAHAQMPKGSENIVPIVNDKGAVEWYEVEADLYKALSGLDVYRLPGLAEVLSIPAQLARMGHTGMRASFALITNPTRDAFTLFQNSRADGSGAELFAGWSRNMVGGLSAAVGNESAMTDGHKLFLRLGGEMAMPLGQDMAHTRRAARRLSQGPIAHTLDPRNAFDTLRGILQFPEIAPRVAEMQQVAKDRGLDLSQPITFDDAIELMIAAKQVTTDFSAAGSFARVWNRLTPFHNAALQSPRASWRAFQRNPARYITRSIVSLTVPTIALWYMNKDEDWWKDLPSREKFSYWHVPVDMPGHEGERIRVPRPYETGALFAAMPEMFLDSWYNEDPDAAKEWVDHFFRVTAPPMVPLAAQETLEQVGNRDSYFDMPIVPMREERKPAEEQYDEFTTRAARYLGDLFGLSPRRIDHAMRSTLGGVSTDLLAATNLLPDPLKLGPEGDSSEWEMADLPVLGRLFARGGEHGTRSKSVDKLFEALDEAQTLQASDRHEETRTERELRLQLADAAKAVTNLYAVRRLTPDKEKRRALTVEVAKIAREALRLNREEAVRRSRVRLERDRSARRKEQAERRASRSEGQGR
jgi:hypothetical protein